MNRNLRRGALAALALICVSLVLVVPSASAHEGEGILEMDARADVDGLSVPYVVRLTWANDGHPAADATVTATAIDAGGTPQTPVPMQAQGDDGSYSATIRYPAAGTWTVRFTAVTPAATLEIVEDIVDAPTSTEATSTIAGPPSTSTSSTGDEAANPAGTDEVDDGGGGVGGVLAAGFLALIVIGGVIGAVRARRARDIR